MRDELGLQRLKRRLLQAEMPTTQIPTPGLHEGMLLPELLFAGIKAIILSYSQ